MVEKIEINLIPNEYRVYRRAVKIPKDILISLLVSILLVGGAFLFYSLKVNERDTLEEDVAEISTKIAAEQHVERQIQDLKEKRQDALAMLNGLSSIPLDHGEWIYLMESYVREIPRNTWITTIEGEKIVPPLPDNAEEEEIEFANQYKMSVTGQTESFGEVGQYMARLKSVPGIDDVEVVEVNSAGDNEGFRFEFRHSFEKVSFESR
ncbi:PilN domain-containing protein [Chitinivibrio alkaliphilus]|uniref:Fimbrial assembly protein PilN n=1 Tax=Chitinivibrio alkaliphilus ACht1 TaxID=1313304 RepID=U7D336_9BACT|nr:PilN domain-containing protein [Chitinivibrio alkaliphilus]ERP30909.1 Fimbrial assembly protein PilN [Chitinivibrio alkaliphilus ACht1]